MAPWGVCAKVTRSAWLGLCHFPFSTVTDESVTSLGMVEVAALFSLPSLEGSPGMQIYL